MNISHLAIWTCDIERLQIFYETYFQASASPRYINEKKQFQSVFLTFSMGARLELMQRPGVKEHPGEEVLGYTHLALSAGSEDRVNSLTQRMIEDGFTCLAGPRHTGDGYYESVILDPDGNRLELTV